MSYYIYFLLDPRTEPYTNGGYSLPHEPIYVGKGKGNRFKNLKNRNKLLLNKVEKIRKDGYEISHVKIGSYTEQESFQVEDDFIKLFGRKIFNEGPLLNISDGGKGSFSHINDDPNHITWNKGKTKETDERLQQTSDKISKSMLGKMIGDKNPSKRKDVRKKISDKLLGHKVTEETREKIRNTLISRRKNDQCA